MLQEVPPPPPPRPGISLLPLKAPEIPPSRRPPARAVSQATTPHSVPRRARTPTFQGKGQEPHAHPRLGPTLTVPDRGSLATCDQGIPARGSLPATPPAAFSVPRRTEMTRPMEGGRALAPPTTEAPPPPRPGLLRSLGCSDLHLSCSNGRLRPVGGEGGSSVHRFYSLSYRGRNFFSI